MVAKKTGDPVQDLPPISRKVLEKAPPGGRYQVPYTVGQLFLKNGWGEHLGKSPSTGRGGMPTSMFQLNADGLRAAQVARGRSCTELERVIYAAVHEATVNEIGSLLEDYSLDALVRDAEALIARVQRAGHSTAGAHGYLDALVQYRDEQARATA